MGTRAEWDVKALPVSSQGKIASVHDRPAACHGPGRCWAVTSRMKSALSPPAFGIFIISGWACECLMQSQWLPGQVIFFLNCMYQVSVLLFALWVNWKCICQVLCTCSGQNRLFRADLWSQFCCSISEPLFPGQQPWPSCPAQLGALLIPLPSWWREETLPFWGALELGRALV